MQPKKQMVKVTTSRHKGTTHNSTHYNGVNFRALMSIMRHGDESDLVSFSIHNEKGMIVHVMVDEYNIILTSGRQEIRIKTEEAEPVKY